jgi:hypothetical protein
MAKYTSGRQKNLKVGISSYSENLTSLDVIGKVGIGTTNADGRSLYVIGNAEVTGILTANRLYSKLYGEFTGGSISGTNIVGTSLSISGISTVGFITASDVYVSGVVTATSFYGNLIGTASSTSYTSYTTYSESSGIATSVIGGIGSIREFQVTGFSTFTNGPVLIGSASSTGTESQLLQVSGGSYISGNLGIGTTNPTSALTVNGDTYISGILTATDINSASDIRLKTNIKLFENTLEKIVQINGVSFNWIENDAKSGGIIAQDLEKVFPELVNEGNHKTVNYNGLIGVLVESIKELKQEIEDLKLRLPEL